MPKLAMVALRRLATLIPRGPFFGARSLSPPLLMRLGCSDINHAPFSKRLMIQKLQEAWSCPNPIPCLEPSDCNGCLMDTLAHANWLLE